MHIIIFDKAFVCVCEWLLKHTQVHTGSALVSEGKFADHSTAAHTHTVIDFLQQEVFISMR